MSDAAVDENVNEGSQVRLNISVDDDFCERIFAIVARLREFYDTVEVQASFNL